MTANGDPQPAVVTHRLSVNVNTPCKDALAELAERHQVSLTEAVRRCISISKFVDDKLQEGCTLQVVAPDGEVSTLAVIR